MPVDISQAADGSYVVKMPNHQEVRFTDPAALEQFLITHHADPAVVTPVEIPRLIEFAEPWRPVGMPVVPRRPVVVPRLPVGMPGTGPWAGNGPRATVIHTAELPPDWISALIHNPQLDQLQAIVLPKKPGVLKPGLSRTPGSAGTPVHKYLLPGYESQHDTETAVSTGQVLPKQDPMPIEPRNKSAMDRFVPQEVLIGDRDHFRSNDHLDHQKNPAYNEHTVDSDTDWYH